MDAYENSRIYKEKTKHWHDKEIMKKKFEPGQQVLVFNSRLKFFPGKLKSKWLGPYIVKKVFPKGALLVYEPKKGGDVIINGHRVKRYLSREVNKETSTIRLIDAI